MHGNRKEHQNAAGNIEGREMHKAENWNNVNEKVVEKETCIYPISAGNTDQKVIGDIPNMTVWKVSKMVAEKRK